MMHKFSKEITYYCYYGTPNGLRPSFNIKDRVSRLVLLTSPGNRGWGDFLSQAH